MNANNQTLKERALHSLSGKWDIALGTFFICSLITIGTAFIPGVGNFVGIFVDGPLSLGVSMFSLRLSKNQPIATSNLFEGFNHFGIAVSAAILMGIFTVLWGLLLIVPGIIAAISYSQTFYILAENPSMSGMEAIEKSKEMMQGHKARFFGLVISFIGWFLLALLSAGIGFLWLSPYFHLTLTQFYQDLKGDELETDLTIPDVLDAN